MAFNPIEIPGGRTSFEGQPSVEIVAGGDEPLLVRVRCHAAPLDSMTMEGST